MKTVRLDPSKLLGFHAVKSAKTASAKSAAKVGTKIGVKPA